jgi:signal transduction histidine kinase
MQVLTEREDPELAILFTLKTQKTRMSGPNKHTAIKPPTWEAEGAVQESTRKLFRSYAGVLTCITLVYTIVIIGNVRASPNVQIEQDKWPRMIRTVILMAVAGLYSGVEMVSAIQHSGEVFFILLFPIASYEIRYLDSQELAIVGCISKSSSSPVAHLFAVAVLIEGSYRALCLHLFGAMCIGVNAIVFRVPLGTMADCGLMAASIARQSVFMVGALLSLCFLCFGENVRRHVVQHFSEVEIWEQLCAARLTLLKEREERDLLFASITHELRNPLHAVVGSVELLQTETEPDRITDLLTTCNICCDTILMLINNVLHFFKMAAHKVQIASGSCSFADLLSRVLRMMRAVVQKKGLYLRYKQISSLPPAVLTDEAKLSQLTINLISNAIKFTEKGGVTVKVDWTQLGSAEDVEKEIELRVNTPTSHISCEEEERRPHTHPVVDEGLDTATPITTIEHYQSRALQNPLPNDGGPYIRSSREPSEDSKRGRELRKLPTDEGGNVGVLKIEVIDTGVGIALEEQARLFMPYEQGRGPRFDSLR